MTLGKPITLEDFQRFTEQHDGVYELIDGEIVEMSPNFSNAYFEGRLLTMINNWIWAQSPEPGRATGSDGGYVMPNGQQFNPDVGYITTERMPQRPEASKPAPMPPDFAAEFVSPSDLEHKTLRIDKKLATYLAAKVPLVWYFYPQDERVEVYAHGAHVRTADIDDTLDGRDVFPGLSIRVGAVLV